MLVVGLQSQLLVPITHITVTGPMKNYYIILLLIISSCSSNNKKLILLVIYHSNNINICNSVEIILLLMIIVLLALSVKNKQRKEAIRYVDVRTLGNVVDTNKNIPRTSKNHNFTPLTN